MDITKAAFHKDLEAEDCKFIDFEMNGGTFYVQVMENKGIWKPYKVAHNRMTEICPLCKKWGNLSFCEVFDKKKKDELYEQLMKRKEIRVMALMKGMTASGRSGHHKHSI